MIKVMVKNLIKNKVSKVKIKNKMTWYDDVKKEMLYFEGGKFIFEYKEDPYLVKMGESERLKRGINGTFRLLPKVVDLEGRENKKVSNKNDLIKWFDEYSAYNDTFAEIDFIGEDAAVFSVPENDVDDFSYQLERNGFNCNI